MALREDVMRTIASAGTSLKARDIAARLGVDRKEVNQVLYGELEPAGLVEREPSSFRWRLPCGSRTPFRDPSFSDRTVFALGRYLPWRIGRYDPFSVSLLAFKKGDPTAIEYFFSELEPLLADGFAICVVPAHDPATVYSSLHVLATRLATAGRINASTCLVRHQAIQRLSAGGDRSVDVHLRSVVVTRTELVRSRTVLLLDDDQGAV